MAVTLLPADNRAAIVGGVIGGILFLVIIVIIIVVVSIKILIIIIPYSCERTPMGSAPYFKLKMGRPLCVGPCL